MRRPSQNEMRDLELLRVRLRRMSQLPEQASHPTAALRASVEQQAQALARQRRLSATALGALGVAAMVGAVSMAVPARTSRPSQAGAFTSDLLEAPSGQRVTVERSTAAAVFELRPGVGNLLAKPGATFTYDAAKRVVVLHAGEIIVNLPPNGQTFRVVTDSVVVQVAGALFAINAPGAVRVWHGTVHQLDLGSQEREGASSQTLTGDEQYGDLSKEDAHKLAFTIPEKSTPTVPSSISSADSAEHSERAQGDAARSAARAETLPLPQPSPAHRPVATAPSVASALPPSAPHHANARSTHEAAVDIPSLSAPASNPERGLLLEAQVQLSSGAPRRTRELLKEHERQYPSSVLAEERALLGLQALIQLQDHAGLERETSLFVEKFPNSSHTNEIRERKRAFGHSRHVATPASSVPAVDSRPDGGGVRFE